jgi:hypothetical protein
VGVFAGSKHTNDFPTISNNISSEISDLSRGANRYELLRVFFLAQSRMSDETESDQDDQSNRVEGERVWCVHDLGRNVYWKFQDLIL